MTLTVVLWPRVTQLFGVAVFERFDNGSRCAVDFFSLGPPYVEDILYFKVYECVKSVTRPLLQEPRPNVGPTVSIANVSPQGRTTPSPLGTGPIDANQHELFVPEFLIESCHEFFVLFGQI
jgi:hypothetical protein